MANKLSFSIAVNNTEEVRAALEKQKDTILKECGQLAIGYAVNGITQQKKFPGTGNLARSISAHIEGDTVAVGSALKYAPYFELGTGIYATQGSGAKKIPWVYYNEQIHSFVTTFGQRPKPYLRPAFKDHIDDYKTIIENGLKR